MQARWRPTPRTTRPPPPPHPTPSRPQVPITPEIEKQFNTAYERLGSMGERVLGFSMRSLAGYTNDYAWASEPATNFPTDDLTFVGLLSLIDPPREGVKEAVRKCSEASIKVRRLRPPLALC